MNSEFFLMQQPLNILAEFILLNTMVAQLVLIYSVLP